MAWEAVIGLEIHVQLLTRSKLFSGAPTAYGAEPNRQACLIDLGFPGTLPVLNGEAVRMAIKFGLAIGAEIARRSVFARKHYFYPDLPKGYQISQYELPILKGGHLTIEVAGREKRVRIQRAHLEEDAGKLLHEGFDGMSGVDFNRAGVPLIEVVSAPDLRSPEEAVAYMKRLHQLVVYLGICDGNMQEGSFRCDANVSVRPEGSETFGTRTEIKNVNSFRFVERALRYEIARQIELLESGGEVVQETRLYDPDLDETRPMRTKEEAHDYRYFPCPDLLPLLVTEEMIEEVRQTLPELPDARKRRFCEQYGLKPYDAEVLTSSRELADYYEEVVAEGVDPKMAANWVMVELLGALKKRGLSLKEAPIAPSRLAGLLKRIEDGTISGRVAKEVFEKMWESGEEADAIIEREGLRQISDASALEALVEQVLAEHPRQVEQFLAGKEKLFGFFVGQIMKATRGKANPKLVGELLRRKLEERR